MRDAAVDGTFRSLPVRNDCQLDVLEFDWMWQWPSEPQELGRINLLRDLPTTKLPDVPAQSEVPPVTPQPDHDTIINALASKAGLTVVQARAFLQAQAELAGELIAQGYPIPGLGLLTRRSDRLEQRRWRLDRAKGKRLTSPRSGR
jgi:hypothetical protein